MDGYMELNPAVLKGSLVTGPGVGAGPGVPGEPSIEGVGGAPAHPRRICFLSEYLFDKSFTWSLHAAGGPWANFAPMFGISGVIDCGFHDAKF